MIVRSQLTLEASYEKEEGLDENKAIGTKTDSDKVVSAKVFLVLNETDKEIIETDNIIRLEYDSKKPSKKYSNIGVSDLFEYYMDSYDIKIFKLFETLCYVPNKELFKTIEIKCFNLLESNQFDNFRDKYNIEIHLVTANNTEIGYLIKDGSCGEEDFANFYFINKEAAVWYFGIYFGYGEFPLKDNNQVELETIPKPFDVDVLLAHYCKIDDVVFDRRILLIEFVKNSK